MSADCIYDIQAGLLKRQCPYNGDALVHRGTLQEFHADFGNEGWFRDDYSLSTFEDSMTSMHQSAFVNGVYINYVGPGQHTIVVPMRDKKGRPIYFKVKDVRLLAQTEWAADGTNGCLAEHKRSGEIHQVTGNSLGPDHPGLLHVVTVMQGAERWLLTSNGTGRTPIQRVRMLQGNVEWMNWIASLESGMMQEFDVSSVVEQSVGSRTLARQMRMRSSAIELNRTNGVSTAQVIELEIAASRRQVSWLQPLAV